MQSFLSVKSELARQRDVPEEVLQVLRERGYPPIAHSSKVQPTEASAQHGETFLLRFASAPPPKLAPVGPSGDATNAVLQILGPELGASPLFLPAAPASASLVRRALGAAAAAGVAAPKLWLSGELARRGALRRLPFLLLESLPIASPLPALATSVCALPADTPGLTSGLPRYDDADALITELRRIAILSGATELDAPLARLATACKETHQLTPASPQIMLHREALCPLPTPKSVAAALGGVATAVELEAAPAPAGPDAAAGCGSYAPWSSVAVGDVRLLESDGEPWELLRCFCHVVKARWLIDVLRKTPGTAPRCDLAELLKAHDASQALLAGRGWLPAAIVAPGSSSAKLAETFPEEMCPHY